MKRCDLTAGIRLWLFVSIWAYFAQPGLAEEKILDIPQLRDINFPATSAKLLVQQPSPTNPPATSGEVIGITGVKANPTEKGVEVILETAAGDKLQVVNRSTGNNFIADITGSQLRLPDGNAFTFKSEKPIEGITEITVINLDANTMRVTVVGEKALPAVELFDDDAGLIFAVASTATTAQEPEKPPQEKPEEQPAAQQDDPIELVVTGEADSYRVPNASTATRTDTPLRDIPQSIQVVPRQVLEDQNVTRLQDAVRNNAPGVTNKFGQNQNFVIRGFDQFSNLRNGFRTSSGFAPLDLDLANVERIEVLRGPASVLFGQLQPGGIINTVTKQPLSTPYYNIKFTGGQFSFYRPELDFSAPLTDDGNLKYRLNAAYQNYGSFRDFSDKERFFIAPVLQWDISKDTTLTLDFSYTYTDSVLNFGVVALSDGSLVLPFNRALFYPSLDTFTEEQVQATYRLEHQFSNNWQLRNAFSYSRRREDGANTYILGLIDDRFVDIGYADNNFLLEDYQFQTDLIGKFTTGSIKHNLLLGFDITRGTSVFEGRDGVSLLPSIDIFNPNYNVSAPDTQTGFFSTTFTDSFGVYIQDQIDIANNLHLLVGGRFDITEQYGDTLGTFSSQTDTAFSPRVGIVYQPSKPISIYASYSQSFTPVIGRSRTGGLFKPERGNQYEIGIKADITDRLSATLAAFEITKRNVLTPDPVDTTFSIQTGEQRSRGVESTIGGEILPGWNIIAGYAYTDARITKDNSIPVGNFLSSVPENAANLWTTYEIQRGNLKGLGFGFGLVFVGKRQGDLPNSNFQLPSYVRADAALFYRRDNWKAAINVNNLFDTQYYESAASRLNVYPGAPFNVQANISYEF